MSFADGNLEDLLLDVSQESVLGLLLFLDICAVFFCLSLN